MRERILQGRLRPGAYHDSGTLMRLARALEAWPGIRRAAAVMCTPRNLETLARMGLAPPVWTAPPKPDDLFVVVDALSAEEATEALEQIDTLFADLHATDPSRLTQPTPPRTLGEALARLPAARLALVSVPGEHAAREARTALDAGLDVMLFSDGVSLDDEVALKEHATASGRLVLGPGCGAALLDGVPLGFANAVRRGTIGVLGASGADLQAVSCLVHRHGGGISHGLAAGSRDLRPEVGGRTTLGALARLADDPATRVLVLLGRQADPTVASRVLDRAVATGRPVVACFLGPHDLADRPGVTFASTLEEAAHLAAALAGHPPTLDPEPAPTRPLPASGAPLLRALFLDATLATEALSLLSPTLALGSNVSFPGAADTLSLRYPGHSVLSLGEEDFTRGRPHPILDPSLRNTALRIASDDPRVAVILFDLVLGSAVPPDPAGDLVPVLRSMRAAASRRGASLALVASATGTDDDPQARSRQVVTLTAEGVEICPSSAAAVRRAAALLSAEIAPTRCLDTPATPRSDEAPEPAEVFGIHRGVITLGLDVFAQSLRDHDLPVVALNWRPPTAASPSLPTPEA